MGRLGSAARAQPVDQRLSWRAVNGPCKQWCLCADPGPLGGKNSCDNTSQQEKAEKAWRQHMISVLTFALIAFCSLLLLLKNRKQSLCQSETVFSTLTCPIHFQPFCPMCACFYSDCGSWLFFFKLCCWCYSWTVQRVFKWRKCLSWAAHYGQAKHFLGSHDLNALLFPPFSALMFFQGSAFWPKSDELIDPTFFQKEADSVCVILFFCFTDYQILKYCFSFWRYYAYSWMLLLLTLCTHLELWFRGKKKKPHEEALCACL